MTSTRTALLCFGLAVAACGSDDETPCSEGVEVGQSEACPCDDMKVGERECLAGNVLGECVCQAGPSGSGMGGATAGGAGGTSAAGGAGGTGAMGGTGATMGGAGGTGAVSDDDAGVAPPSGGTMAPEPIEIPTHGNQASGCEDDRDCNMGLGCHATPLAVGFCTATCESDDDCAGIDGADFTCGGEGLCRPECAGPMDDESCPEDMQCFAFGGGGGGGGGGRCAYPPPPPGTGELWEPCATGMDCDDGLFCYGGSFGAPGGSLPASGYCAEQCMTNVECSAAPASSGIDATCQPTGGGGMAQGVCALDCFGAPDDCPEDMVCRGFGGGAQRCGYQP